MGDTASGPEARPVSTLSPFLAKPFRPAALLEAVHRLLKPRRKSRN
jgi:hypothetical protein